MQRRFPFFMILLLPAIFFLSSCGSVPVTGRRQLKLIPDSQINSMSYGQYDEFLASNKLSEDPKKTAMVKRCGRRIQNAVEEYFAQRNMSDVLEGYRWEFNLVKDDTVNAWCMPGGKVVINTGILPIAKNETGLAVVMGHEIAHAIANHGNERMSQSLLVNLGTTALDKALEDEPETTRKIFMTSVGVGSKVGVLLPYSRLHETEADRLGLKFMAMAGYDPREAIDFWGRMADLKGGESTPEFLSTHPSDETRIADLREMLPEALEYYNPSEK